MCMRVTRGIPGARLLYVPDAAIVHHFEPQLRDTLRRSRWYGMGSARLHCKWRSMPLTLFPWPVLVLLLVAASVWVPALAAAAVLAPLALYPRGLRCAASDRQAVALLDAYVKLAQETCENIGIAHGYWRFRRLIPEQRAETANSPGQERLL
jgi:hypothetical protein